MPRALYGIVAEEDIGKLFIAGGVPGLLLVGLCLVSIAAVTAWRPSYGPRGAGVPAAERWRAYLRVWPVLLLFLVVLGGIYLGVFTPTEAAAVGAFGAYVFARLRGRLRSFMELIDALAAAARTSAMIFIIVFAAQMLSQLVNLSGMPYDLVDWVESQEVGQVGLVLLICLIGIVMGMIFESLGIILLLVPVFLPSLYAADVNLIWFGIVIIVIAEIGLITPSIGLTCSRPSRRSATCRSRGSSPGCCRSWPPTWRRWGCWRCFRSLPCGCRPSCVPGKAVCQAWPARAGHACLSKRSWRLMFLDVQTGTDDT